ncbi:MAG: hypothetical protein KF852_04175 [Saprospiraceae bacterium]|nr:hypothetical protein [Saprospiraceae bacterium]
MKKKSILLTAILVLAALYATAQVEVRYNARTVPGWGLDALGDTIFVDSSQLVTISRLEDSTFQIGNGLQKSGRVVSVGGVLNNNISWLTGTNNVNILGISSYIPFSVQNFGSGGGIFASSLSGTGISGSGPTGGNFQGSGIGIVGAGGIGGVLSGNLTGARLTGTNSAPALLAETESSGDSIVTAAIIRKTYNTLPGIGNGTRIVFDLRDGFLDYITMAHISSKFTRNYDLDSLNTNLEFGTMTDSDSVTTKLTIQSNGQIKLNEYIPGQFIGTGTGRLVVDADGAVWQDTSSLTSGTVGGTGTPNTLAMWTGPSTLGDSPLTNSSGNVTANGTGAFTVPVGTTAQQPGSPVVGMTRYNSTTGNFEFRGASAWESLLKSATANGLGTAGQVFFPDANGRATGSANLFFNSGTTRLGIGTNAPTNGIDVRGGVSILKGIVGTTVGSNYGAVTINGIYAQVNSDNDYNTTMVALGNNSNGVGEVALKSRSTNGTSFVTVQANDNIWYKQYVADGGSSGAMDDTGYEYVSVDGAIVGGYIPGRWSMQVRANNNTNTYHQLHLRASRRFGVFTENPDEALHVAGKAKVDTLVGTGTQIAGWTSGNVATTLSTSADIEVREGGVIGTKTRRGTVSTSTDGSGDVAVSITMPDSTFATTVQVVGTTPYITTVHTKGTGGFIVRFFDTSGAAVTSTAVEFDWSATDN